MRAASDEEAELFQLGANRVGGSRAGAESKRANQGAVL